MKLTVTLGNTGKLIECRGKNGKETGKGRERASAGMDQDQGPGREFVIHWPGTMETACSTGR